MSDWTPVIGDPAKVIPPPRSAGARLAALYSCRVPITAAVFLVLLPLICLKLAPTLLRNLLVMSAWGAFWSIAAAYVLSWSIQVTYRVTAINRNERLRLPGPDAAKPPSFTATLLTRLLPVPLVIAMAALKGDYSPASGWPAFVLAVAGGYALAYTLSFFAIVLAATVAPPGHVRTRDFFLTRLGWQNRLVDRAENKQILSAGFVKRLEDSARGDWPDGYVDREGRLYGGHWIALTSFTLSLLLYIVLGIARSLDVPALSNVLQLVFLLVWMLAGASFFLDRFRIPLLAPFAIWCAIGFLPSLLPSSLRLPAWLPSSDHYYNIWPMPKGQPAPASPAQVLEAFRNKTRNHIIVVATAGGGIQAAAWTAEVLTNLQLGIGPVNFADSVAAFSGVSGGAVGMMLFGSRYQGNRAPFTRDNGEMDRIVAEAETTTLNDVAWGLTHPDATRALLPFLRFGPLKLDDRGSALEKEWKKTINNASLGAWTFGPKDGTRPAFLFNSTVAETGEPFLFATSALTYGVGQPGTKYAHRNMFFERYPGYDVGITTAARMAASFPFVTPAARPLTDKPENHQVDGGYYDNYGLNSLIAWLSEAIDNQAGGSPKPNILLLQIRSFPQDTDPAPVRKTWFYQTYAPIDALFNVRTTGQLLRDDEAVRVFQDAYIGKANIVDACFEFAGENAPLTWQLSASQAGNIKSNWRWEEETAAKVQEFLEGKLDKSGQRLYGCRPVK